jgi:hypothetical protein
VRVAPPAGLGLPAAASAPLQTLAQQFGNEQQ